MGPSIRSFALLFFFIAARTVAQVNDNCSGAVDIDLYAPDDCLNYNITVNFNSSSISTNPPFCDEGAAQIRDFWYRFYSANNTTVTIYLESLQSSHIGFGVYTICGGSAVACLSNIEGYVDIPVVPDTHYYLQMYTVVDLDPSNSGFFCLHWNNAPPGPPANDDCVSATQLNVGATCVYTNGNSTWATTSSANTLCNPNIIASDNDDVWYRFVAPVATTVVTVDGDGTSTMGYDAVLVLASASSCAGPFNVIACSNATGPGGEETITTDVLVPGATYYVRVYDLDGASPQPGTFGICVYAPDFMGVDDATQVENVLLMPTGSLGIYTLRTPFTDAAICDLRVLDAMGRTVQTEHARLVPASPHLLDLSALVPGTYTVFVQRGGEARTQRFIHF